MARAAPPGCVAVGNFTVKLVLPCCSRDSDIIPRRWERDVFGLILVPCRSNRRDTRCSAACDWGFVEGRVNVHLGRV